MLYVHKFIAGWLLPPGGIIVMLFLLCGYCFKKRSRLRYPLTAVTVKSYYVKGGFCHLIHMTAAHLW